MFTGIVTAVGEVREAREADGGLELTIACPYADLAAGESIAVDGACLTAASVSPGAFTAHLVRTTLERTGFAAYAVGRRVNLERALRVGDPLGGHLVQGHVDGVGTLESVTPEGHSYRLRFLAPAELLRYVVDKGSITVDGISLTVAALGDGWFEVAIIPHTWHVTNLSEHQPGATVNLEVDILAKYVERLMGARVRS